MTSRDFCYWFQGMLEIADPKTLNEEQINVIKNHLNMVFLHEIDPSFGDHEHIKDLKDVHDGKKKPRDNHDDKKWPVKIEHRWDRSSGLITC